MIPIVGRLKPESWFLLEQLRLPRKWCAANSLSDH